MWKAMGVCRSTHTTNFYILFAYTRNQGGSQQLLNRWAFSLKKHCQKVFEPSFHINKGNTKKHFEKNAFHIT